MIIQIIIIQVLTFAALLFVLRILFHRQLSIALTRLRTLHEENVKKEAELKKELELIKQQRDQEIAQAKQEAANIIKEARVRSERLASEMQTQAAQAAKSVLDQGNVKVEFLKNEILNKEYADALNLARGAFEAVFTDLSKDKLSHMLVAELIEEIQKLDKTRFTVSSDKVKIISALQLSDEERSRLKAILSEKTGFSVSLEEVIDTGIIAGLIIQIDVLTIDGSLRNKLEKAFVFLKSRQNNS